MDWLKKFISDNPFHALLLPTALSTTSFFIHLADACSDGLIDSYEYHQVLVSSSAVQTIILFVMIYALVWGKKKAPKLEKIKEKEKEKPRKKK